MTEEIALKVMQDAVSVLARWAGTTIPDGCEVSKIDKAVEKAKEILSWKDENLGELELIFDYVKLGKNQREKLINYVPVRPIEDSEPTIPYPVEKKEDFDLIDYKHLVKEAVENLKPDDCKNLSLLTLIVEKYGSCLSFCQRDVALIDMAKSVAGVACAIAHNPEAENICLVAGDLSGIQKFIYTISADGALKSLRARSFYLELVAEEIVQQLLERLNLPRTSVIYSGGGNLYLLAPATENTEKVVKDVRSSFNKWLKKEFQEKVFLALDCYCFRIEDVANKKIGDHWNEAIAKVNQQKSRKFIEQISDVLTVKKSYEQRCRVCHRDDTTDLKPLSKENDAVPACKTCREMYELGGKLLGVKALVRSSEKDIKGLTEPIAFELEEIKSYYHICENRQTIVKGANAALYVNDWTINSYEFISLKSPAPLLLGNYAKRVEEIGGKIPRTMRGEELAEEAKGVKRVGYLRMDVDRLGQIFAKGLGDKHSLTRLAGLSRQMSYFFKTYLNSLAKNRVENLPENLKDAKVLKEGEGDRLVFIYAGGDDLFVSGSWNEVVDFAFDVYQAFRAYTGYNPDITLSGGISIAGSKFPLYQSAEESGEAESAAKGNGRDSLGLFGEVFKWDEWLGTIKQENLEKEIQTYLNPESMPSLWGIIPFVEKLENVDANYSRSFVRNLLATAQIQSQKIKEIEEKRKGKESYKDELKDIRYYLHLPKIAYTLARLPKSVLEDADFRTSLKSPYNAPYFRAIATWIELLNRKTD
jgi:CRISPR-associated protein Csm1